MYIETALSALQRYLVDPSDASTLFVDESVFKLTTADKRQIRSMIREAGADRIRNVTKGERVVYQQDPRIFSGPDEMYLRYLFAPESIVRGDPPECAPECYLPMSALPTAQSGWPIKEERVSIPLGGEPERVVLSLLSQHGWRGTFTEGHMLRTLFRALLLPYLFEHNPFKRFDSTTPMLHAIHALIPMCAGPINMSTGQARIERERIDEMHYVLDERLAMPAQAIAADFELITEIARPVWPKAPPDDSPVELFLSAVAPEFWHSLLEAYAMNNWALAHGWPDLELTNGKDVMLVEVKVRDRLTQSQRATIPVLMGMGIKCRVIRLIR
ncbi:VRR-NUC domain-containing protein [Stutzerimonas nitrititolerans]|uniref:VRR-NUC domain-containing protein n=1 Tax=Stutzerimonas nitrititolerans TaxID=2482751 RepID=UPI0028A96AC5|nr:VRR-NUC domain-containing protein [Stutzerimonas nitrititolerans]